MYPILRVDQRMAEALEPLGTKSKFWFTNASGVRTLFKAEERGTGEDWAEKVACELAGMIGLPRVHYELAIETETQTPGVLCSSIAPAPIEMRLGNQLLQMLDPAYPNAPKYHVSEHTIDAVVGVLHVLEAPPPPQYTTGLPGGIKSAMDVFAGYMLLDAWIANQDRHHENWAGLLISGRVYLAPTFDHGASMARNLSDAERYERLTSKDRNRQIPAFARRARSALYASVADRKALTTVAAWNAFASRAAASVAWLERLRNVSADRVRAIFDEIPPERMSAVCRDFTLRLLEENRRRLLDREAE